MGARARTCIALLEGLIDLIEHVEQLRELWFTCGVRAYARQVRSGLKDDAADLLVDEFELVL